MNKVGLVYHPVYLEHETGAHPENSARLRAIMGYLEKGGLLPNLVRLEPREATLEELALVHSRDYIALVERVAVGGGSWMDPDTYVSPGSYRAAVFAVGGVLRALEAVLAGEVESALALVRPPGHHATHDQAMGFCLFNNVSIAARVALDRQGLGRVLIADFDVHHGNGTQDIFYQEPRVLYFSTHQFPHYPGTGRVEETGSGTARGTKVNVPLPARCGDEEYQRAFAEVLVPVARRFRPDLILVSAGYDAHWADGLSSMQVSGAGFASMAEALKELAGELCQGRLVLTLEGGYDLQALAASVGATAAVFLGLPPPADTLGPPPYHSPPSIDNLLRQVKEVHGL